MGIAVDLDILGRLASTLHGFAQEVAAIKPKDAPDPNTTGAQLVSVAGAGEITRELVYGALVATARQRLDETGTVMTACVTEFKNAEDSNYDDFVAAYNGGTGSWTAQPGE
ncbi:hypothetical protein [Nocardia sp. alder85J]|uniref:hypothetical protein n=1 Tax=Nocardia sp. alder85J TaxID=2862949 RepID=UPI001CD5F93E|nr:hypothetical protein [Nocardia sp. alder85J]MCX4092091.1 hypothetical protein [Nocardia sp. alder85J]